MNFKIGLIEFVLIQLIVYTAIWMISDYIGFFITLTFPVLITAVLLISLIAEWIEPSRVPRIFFKFLLFAILTPLIVLMFFTALNNGHWAWMDQL